MVHDRFFSAREFWAVTRYAAGLLMLLSAVDLQIAGTVAAAEDSAAAAAARVVEKPAVRVVVDPRVELICVVFRLAGHPEYNRGRIQAYVDEVEKHFGAYRDHAVVTLARKLRRTRGVSFDACMSMAVHLSDMETIGERVPFDPRPAGLDGRWVLPERADMGLDLGALLAAPIGHGSLLIVENRQTFIELWRVRKDLLEEVSRTNPLVVFRGDAETGSRADATHRLITSTDLPVFAFVDFDPAGMVIAAGLPRLDKLVSPNFDELGRLIRDHGLSERFMSQVAAPKMALEKLESDKVVGLVLRVIMKASKGLPQEFFHRGGISP